MPDIVFRDWQPLDADRSDRSAGDRSRHRLKVREAIRQNIADIIAEESIIGRNRDQIIKVPIRGIKEYRFRFGPNSPRVAEGGKGLEPGQVLGEPDQEVGPGGPGSDPGLDYYETEITLEELIEIMFEDLELPRQERKKLRQTVVDSNFKLSGFRRKGIWPRVSLNRTARERVKRLQKTRRSLDLLRRMETQGHPSAGNQMAAEDPETAYTLAQKSFSNGTRKTIWSKGAPTHQKGDRHNAPVERFRFRNEDLRFHHRKHRPRRESNAVVVCIMDTSGSMDTSKKYLARSFFFLLYSFVSRKYANVELSFIAHHTQAREVAEDEFFHKGESGGTYISSGYEKALEIIQERYHPSLWNVYAFHCSDGDNFDSDNERTLDAARRLCKQCNLFGYGEIKPLESSHYESSLLDFFSEHIQYENYKSILIKKKEDIWSAFKEFLKRDND